MSRISDLKLNHPGEWMAIAVTAYEEDEPSEGVLLAHAPDRWMVMQGFRLQRGRQIIVAFADEWE